MKLTAVYPEILSGKLNTLPTIYSFSPGANLDNATNTDAFYATLPLADATSLTIYPTLKDELRVILNKNGITEDNGEIIIQGDSVAADGSKVKANILEVYFDYYLTDEYENTGDFRIIPISDANNDGIADCKVLYSDGDEQILFVTYEVENSRNNICKDTAPQKKLGTTFQVLETVSNKTILFNLPTEESVKLSAIYPEVLNGSLNTLPTTYRFAADANLNNTNNPDAFYATLALADESSLTIYPSLKEELSVILNNNGIVEEKGEVYIKANKVAGNGAIVEANVLEIYFDYYLTDEYEDTGDLRIIPISDVNNDGIADCKVLYSDGSEQLLYVVYDAENTRNNTCIGAVPNKKQ